jgi:hypothetical protein
MAAYTRSALRARCHALSRCIPGHHRRLDPARERENAADEVTGTVPFHGACCGPGPGPFRRRRRLPGKGTNHRGVPVLGLQPPREARSLVSTGIGRVGCRCEVGENRIIDGRDKPGDLDLSELARQCSPV